MKYYVCVMIIICTMPIKGLLQGPRSTRGARPGKYYISDSPYYTAGYLGAHTQDIQRNKGPSPYWRSRTIPKPVSIFLRRKYI